MRLEAIVCTIDSTLPLLYSISDIISLGRRVFAKALSLKHKSLSSAEVRLLFIIHIEGGGR